MSGAPYRLRLELPGLSRVNTAATRASRWRQYREARRLQELVVLLVPRRKRPSAPLSRARVTLTRHSSVEPDHEQLAMGFKAVLDALTARGRGPRARVLEDDSPRHVERVYRWEKAPPGAGRLTVLVEALEA